MTRLALLVLSLAGCSSRGPRTLEDVLGEVQQEYAKLQEEYEILAPSLHKAAQEIVATFENQGLEFSGLPSLECKIQGDSSRNYRSPDGTRRKDFYTRTYAVQAVETVRRYRVVGPESIARSGKADRPFKGVVKIEIETVERKSEMVLSPEIKEPVPAGWTPTGEVNEARVVYAREAPDRRAPTHVPLPPVPQPLPIDLPPLDRHELGPVAERASRACLQSPATLKLSYVSLNLWLDAGRKRWVP
jgi:hypothetical protein